MIRIQDVNGGLVKESYEWIFNHPEFTSWRKHDRSSVLWINGAPGKGKTMLLMGIIQALLPLKSDSSPICISYFFCEGADKKLTSATSVLRGLIYMIVMERPEALSHLDERYNRAGRQLFEDINAFYALSEIFRDIIKDLQVVLVTDAIDECREGLPQLLDLIGQTIHSSSKVKWVISSRDRPDIASRIKYWNGVVNLNLEVNWRYVTNAVESYLNQKLPVIAEAKGYDSQLYQAVRECLRARAEDSFLWISAVCKVLGNTPRRKTFSVLKTLPAELKIVYQEMLNQVQSIDDTEDQELCLRILASVASSRRPIRLKDLSVSARLPSEYIKDQSYLKELIYLCGSFLTVRDDVVSIIHSSAREFLVAEVFGHNTKEANRTGSRYLQTRPNASESQMR